MVILFLDRQVLANTWFTLFAILTASFGHITVGYNHAVQI